MKTFLLTIALLAAPVALHAEEDKSCERFKDMDSEVCQKTDPKSFAQCLYQAGYRALGSKEDGLNKYICAEALLKSAIEENPAHGPAYYYLSLTYAIGSGLKAFDESEEQFENACYVEEIPGLLAKGIRVAGDKYRARAKKDLRLRKHLSHVSVAIALKNLNLKTKEGVKQALLAGVRYEWSGSDVAPTASILKFNADGTASQSVDPTYWELMCGEGEDCSERPLPPATVLPWAIRDDLSVVVGGKVYRMLESGVLATPECIGSDGDLSYTDDCEEDSWRQTWFVDEESLCG